MRRERDALPAAGRRGNCQTPEGLNPDAATGLRNPLDRGPVPAYQDPKFGTTKTGQSARNLLPPPGRCARAVLNGGTAVHHITTDRAAGNGPRRTGGTAR